MRKRWIILIFFIVVSFFAMAASCDIERRVLKKATELQEELCKQANDYNRLIAWRYYDEASQMVLPERRADFLMEAEMVANRVKMEGFKVALCQVTTAPPPRLRGEITPTPMPVPTPMPEPVPAGEETPPEPTPELVMPDEWYGIALVRYVHLSVAPSNTVSSPLLRQYWVCRDDVWYVDPDLRQLLEITQPGTRPPAPTPQPMAPVIPGP